jgi:DNA repair ATPase RecN
MMEEKILQVIKESIPAMQVGVILNELEESDRNREAVKTLKQNLKAETENYENALKDLREKSDQLEAIQKRLKNIEQREKALKDLETQIAVDAQKLICEKEKVALLCDTIDIVFKNTQIKRKIFASEAVPVNDCNYPVNMETNKTETVSEE